MIIGSHVMVLQFNILSLLTIIHVMIWDKWYLGDEMETEPRRIWKGEISSEIMKAFWKA